MSFETVQSHEGEGLRAFQGLAITQGAYYVATGVWPLVSMKTFMVVTGPKLEPWLVKTVGLLVAVIGGVVAYAGLRRHRTPEIPLLAGGSAAALAGVDIVYSAKGRIARRYLLDAAVELALVGGWIAVAARSRRS